MSFLPSIPWYCWVVIGLAVSLLTGILGGKLIENKRHEMEAAGLLRRE